MQNLVVYAIGGRDDSLTCVCLSICLLAEHTHMFNGPLHESTRAGQYQKGKTNLDFTEARDSEW